MEHPAACASQLPGDRLIELICGEPVRALAAQERELCVNAGESESSGAPSRYEETS
jgi:hypothetical protein